MKIRNFTPGLLVIVLLSFLSLHVNAQCCVAPVSLAVKSIGKTEADLQWRRITQIGCTTPTKYKVQYRAVGTTTWLSVIVRTKKDDVRGDTTVTGLTPATTYQWRVEGICSSTNKTAWTAGPNFTTLTPPLVTSAPSSATSSSAQGKLTVTVFPNPVAGQLNLTGHLQIGGATDIQIMNSNGQSVFHQSYNFSQGNFNTKIDVSKFEKGVYMIVITNQTEKVSLKILKE